LKYRRRLLFFLAIFGPATITAMADNDAAGVATYSIAGASLGYPILFALLLITILLAITQEMGIRLAVVTRKGLGDLIRENYGVRVSLVIFFCLFLANTATIIVDVSAIKTMSMIFGLPQRIVTISAIFLAFLFVSRGNYKVNQNVLLFVCLFYFSYIFSAIKVRPDWFGALSNLIFPNGVTFDSGYIRNYIVIGLGVLGTTITPWGQFFISSFAYDKKIDPGKLKYSQLEAYSGAFLTNFFSFFMIVATASTLFVNKIPLVSGEQAALALAPFAGDMAANVFAVGIFAAGFMGMVTVSLSTAYAFSEFFGYTGSLDSSFQKGKAFYGLFLIQLIIAGFFNLFPSVSLFNLAVAAQTLNAMMLPLVFYYLIKLTSDRNVLGTKANKSWQNYISIGAVVAILAASVLSIIFVLTGLLFK
jgi:Mn2+/Fe2+ NRAMP family transporter